MKSKRWFWLLVECGAALVLCVAGPSCGPNASSGGNGDGGADGAKADGQGQTVDAFVTDPNVDDDGDGYTENQGDCDDNNPAVHPATDEVCNDGLDNDCDGHTDGDQPDVDGDGYGPCRGDCDDSDPDVHPGRDEVAGNGKDDNCDGVVDADFDGDGYTEAQGDCDDSDPLVNPGMVENCYDGIDNNCNGGTDLDEPDADSDGYGPCQGDCDDTDPNVNPGQPEVAGDGIDNNCDFLVDEDIDGDGWTAANGDCDDANPNVNPAQPEDCDDGIDNDCDGTTDQNCLSPCALAALMRSSVGCVYYAVDTNPIHSFVPGDYAVAVSNIDDTATANVVVEVNNGGTWSTVSGGSFTVAPLSLKTLVLPHRYTNDSALYAGGAYRVTSDLPVIAYQFNPLDGSSSYLSDASLLLPVSAYDRYFRVPAWPYGPADQSNSGYPAHIQIVAAEHTTVQVTSPILTKASNGIPALQPNVVHSFTMEQGDYLQLTVQNYMDSFTGTYVEADKPVAVFTSNDCANVPASSSYCCCEHLEEQVFGLQTWGMHYVASRVPQRGAEPAIWQILASEPNTTISFDAAAQVTGLPPSVTLGAGESVEYQVGGPNAQPGDFFVSADKPILVTQFMVAAFMVQQGGSNGDPSEVQAVPAEQYLKQYVILVPNTWQTDYVVLTRQQGATVDIDGNPVTTGWTPVGTSGYEVARVGVADGVHEIHGSQPLGVIVVGWDAYDSYAYPGGLNQALINPIN